MRALSIAISCYCCAFVIFLRSIPIKAFLGDHLVLLVHTSWHRPSDERIAAAEVICGDYCGMRILRQ